jgi:hypothetical protein
LERAFELAAKGDYVTVEQIRRRLKAEGFSPSQLVGPTLTKQLKDIIRKREEKRAKREQ